MMTSLFLNEYHFGGIFWLFPEEMRWYVCRKIRMSVWRTLSLILTQIEWPRWIPGVLVQTNEDPPHTVCYYTFTCSPMLRDISAIGWVSMTKEWWYRFPKHRLIIFSGVDDFLGTSTQTTFYSVIALESWRGSVRTVLPSLSFAAYLPLRM